MEISSKKYERLKRFLSCKYGAFYKYDDNAGGIQKDFVEYARPHGGFHFRHSGIDHYDPVSYVESCHANFGYELIGVPESKSGINPEFWHELIEHFVGERQPNRDPSSFEYTENLLRLNTERYLQVNPLKGKVVKILSTSKDTLERIVVKHWGRIIKIDTSTLKIPASDLEIGNRVEVYTDQNIHEECRRAAILQNRAYDLNYAV